MADYKGFNGGEAAAVQSLEVQERSKDLRPLFSEFDPETEGGIMVDSGGVLVEVRHPLWKSDGDISLAGRVTEIPYAVNDKGEIIYTGKRHEFTIDTVTLGVETEYGVHHDGKPYEITRDGSKFFAPNGEGIDVEGMDPEAFKKMIEGKTELARGFQDYRQKRVEEAHRAVTMFERHNIDPDFLSVYPEELTSEDVLEHHYVQLMDKMMRNLQEFGCMSEQLNIGHMGPEAGRHALSMYQSYAAIMALVTSAAPIRDGSFETTLQEHYRFGEEDELRARDGSLLVTEDDYLHHKAGDERSHEAPYDSREFSRVYGSQSGGAWEKVPPMDNNTYLKAADEALRDGDVISFERLNGWHTDRARTDRMEVCSLSGAGGNLRKTLAVHELVVSYLTEQQKQFLKAQEKAGDVDANDLLNEERELAVEVGQMNNFFMALSGKETNYRSHDGEIISPRDMLQKMISESGGISEEAEVELLATLEPAPEAGEFESAEKVFERFLAPQSSMTAAEALRIAHEVEPDLPVQKVLSQYSAAVRQHVKDFHGEMELAA